MWKQTVGTHFGGVGRWGWSATSKATSEGRTECVNHVCLCVCI